MTLFEPAPIQWAKPIFGLPGTCLGPASPRNCLIISMICAAAVAPNGCPLDISPPSVFTGSLPFMSKTPSHIQLKIFSYYAVIVKLFRLVIINIDTTKTL